MRRSECNIWQAIGLSDAVQIVPVPLSLQASRDEVTRIFGVWSRSPRSRTRWGAETDPNAYMTALPARFRLVRMAEAEIAVTDETQGKEGMCTRGCAGFRKTCSGLRCRHSRETTHSQRLRIELFTLRSRATWSSLQACHRTSFRIFVHPGLRPLRLTLRGRSTSSPVPQPDFACSSSQALVVVRAKAVTRSVASVRHAFGSRCRPKVS